MGGESVRTNARITSRIYKSMDKIEVGTIELTPEEKKDAGMRYSTIEIAIRYELGGFGGLDWTERKRGYQLDITPCAIIDYGNGHKGRETTGGCSTLDSGGFILIEETKRKSKKRMETLASKVDIEKVKELYLAEKKEELIDYAVSLKD